jgi:adenine phosphoribosyltransferase
MKLNLLIKSLKEAPIIKKGKYQYIIHPITDGIPEIKPDLLKEITSEIHNIIENLGKIDKIVTIEAMGIPIATTLSLKMNIPLTIIRKREYKIPGEISVEQKTGYSKSKLYLNGIKKGDKIVLVDDVISTGGTLKSVLNSLIKIGVIVKAVIIVIDKGESTNNIIKETKIDIHTLIKLEIENGKIIINNY